MGRMDKAAIYERIGQSVRRARLARGLKQSELAELVGMSRTTITNVELGRQSLLVDQLLRLADVLVVEPATLLPQKASVSRPSAAPLNPELSAWIDNLRTRV